MVALILSTCAALLVAPDIHLADLGEPAIGATLGTPLVLAAIVTLRLAGMPSIFERRLLALFLLLMPTVYLSSLALHGGGAPWPAVEIVGQLIFAVLAIAGLRASGRYLALGIAAHGLLWDLWHHGRTTFIPDWYTVGCLLVDVGWGAYAASRVGVWDAEAAAARRDVSADRHRSARDVPAAPRSAHRPA
jgi:hypothetical protein